MICAFSGHRPQRLPWGDDESDPRCAALKVRISQELEALLHRGADLFLCGMALGCDLYFAEAVLALGTHTGAMLWAVRPFAGQSAAWSARQRARHTALCDAAQRVTTLESAYTDGCMVRRNRWMVDRADCLLTVYDGGPGGTGATVRSAQHRGVPIIPVWL